MIRVMMSPGRYVQGKGAMARIGEEVKRFGERPFVIGDRVALPLVREEAERSFEKSGVSASFEVFGGECSMEEIERLRALAAGAGADVIIGIGGGKTIDTAKAVAYYAGLPVVVAPSVASTDAPCSALSVIYTPEGKFERYLVLPRNPELVLVDTGVVARAPVRLLVAGMGDALATWFEADASSVSRAKNLPGGNGTDAAISLARLSYEVLLEHGLRAKLAVERGVVTEDVEKVVEANTLLSGLGFESGGLAAAHSVHNGLTALEETHAYYHGEKVAFGVLVQLVLDNKGNEVLEEVLGFCQAVGLPITLRQIGVSDASPEKIRRVAEASCAEGETIFNMPFRVTPEMVYDAIMAADRIGEYFLEATG